MLLNDQFANDQTDPTSNILNHCKIKGENTQEEKHTLFVSIFDYEESLKIHRELLNEMIKNISKKDEIERISNELLKNNEELCFQLKQSTNDLSKYKAREFINKQIEEFYKQREIDNACEFEDKMKEMTEKMDIKLSEIQTNEKKFADAKLILKKYVIGHDNELQELEKSNKDSKISQVIEENAFLKSLLDEMTNKLFHFGNYIHENSTLKQTNEDLQIISLALKEKCDNQENIIKNLKAKENSKEKGKNSEFKCDLNTCRIAKKTNNFEELFTKESKDNIEKSQDERIDNLNISEIKSFGFYDDILEEDDIFQCLNEVRIPNEKGK